MRTDDHRLSQTLDTRRPVAGIGLSLRKFLADQLGHPTQRQPRVYRICTLKELHRVLRLRGRLAWAEADAWHWPEAWTEFWLNWGVSLDEPFRPVENPLPALAQSLGFRLEKEEAVQGTLVFPNPDWALSFLVRTPLWKAIRRPRGSDMRQVLALAREQLAEIPLAAMSISWSAHYRLWHKAE